MDLADMKLEIEDMTDVLLGREEPPYPKVRVESLYEVANAYFSRGMEMTMMILRGEQEGSIIASSGISKFRKGELRAFCELAKAAAELGSRRITVAHDETEARFG